MDGLLGQSISKMGGGWVQGKVTRAIEAQNPLMRVQNGGKPVWSDPQKRY